MNRQIKFRAWHTVQKKMYSPEEMGRDQLTISPDGRGFVNVSGHSPTLSRYYQEMIPLQFTGVKDCKGQEIYEGDIVHTIDGMDTYTDVVHWDTDDAMWACTGWTGQTIHGEDMYPIASDDGWEIPLEEMLPEYEVIGNIFQGVPEKAQANAN